MIHSGRLSLLDNDRDGERTLDAGHSVSLALHHLIYTLALRPLHVSDSVVLASGDGHWAVWPAIMLLPIRPARGCLHTAGFSR